MVNNTSGLQNNCSEVRTETEENDREQLFSIIQSVFPFVQRVSILSDEKKPEFELFQPFNHNNDTVSRVLKIEIEKLIKNKVKSNQIRS